MITLLVYIVILNTLLSAIIGSNFTDLPVELVSDHIFGSLSVTDKLKSLLPLNKAAHAHIRTYHQQETILFMQLLHELGKPEPYSTSKISNITKTIQLSEIFCLYLPTILHGIRSRAARY